MHIAMTTKAVAAILVVLCVATGCAQVPFLDTEGDDGAENSDIGRTFTYASVFIPAANGVVATRMGAMRKSLPAPLAERSFPTIVYLHGCTGLRNTDVLRQLAAAGFVVIAPDSFARRYRPMQCRPRVRRGGENLFVFDFRLTELSFAVHHLKALPWVDQTRLFLLGNSEGAVAAAHYRGPEFSARVLTQWTCHGGHLVAGISAPPREPILAIVQRDDPWYDSRHTRGQAGDCGAFFYGRPLSQSVVLSDPNQHNIFESPATIGRIVDFLRRVPVHDKGVLPSR